MANPFISKLLLKAKAGKGARMGARIAEKIGGPGAWEAGRNIGHQADKLRHGAARLAKKHPIATAAAAGGAAGAITGRRRRREAPYKLNMQTGTVYYQGTPIGQLYLYGT